MIKLTKVSSTKKDSPILVLIPGGPGLSSLTLRSMDILSRSFNLVYVDFPGTNDNPYEKDKTFEKLSSELATEIQKFSGTKFILGHSYGGFFAADLSLKIQLDGIICIATPFSQKSLSSVSVNYANLKSEALITAENEWENLQDDKSFAKWLSEYDELYFIKPEGKYLILNDKASAIFFLANSSEINKIINKYILLSQNKTKKLFIAGKQDKLLTESMLNEDAIKCGFSFISVNNASHFVTFDQTEIVAVLIEEFSQQNK